MLNSHFLQLILYKTFADIKAEASRTYIGFLWWFIDPFIMMATFYLVFGVFLKERVDNYLPFLLIGVAAWQWFGTTVARGATSIYSATALINQVYIPKILFPSVAVVTGLLKFCILLVILLAALFCYGIKPTAYFFATPLIMLVQLLFTAGITSLSAAIVPFLPDLRNLVDYGLRVLLFLSGVFFDPRALPPDIQTFFFLNPVAVLIDSYRSVLVREIWPDWSALGLVALVGAMIAIVAVQILTRCDRLYPKIAG